MIFDNDTPDSIQFRGSEALTGREPERLQPVFRDGIVPLDVNMPGLVTVARVKIESIRSRP